MSKDLAASVRARLLNLAKAEGTDFNQILVRYSLERFLYRLSQSAHADRFMLKGALLFTLWYDMPNRPTRDADLLGFGPSDVQSIGSTFRDIAAIAVDDGIVFDPLSISVNEIRKEAAYAGVRVLINGDLAKARCKTQIDIGFGDAVTPGPIEAVYPVFDQGPSGATSADVSRLHGGRGEAARHCAARHDQQSAQGLSGLVGAVRSRNPGPRYAGIGHQRNIPPARHGGAQADARRAHR